MIAVQNHSGSTTQNVVSGIFSTLIHMTPHWLTVNHFGLDESIEDAASRVSVKRTAESVENSDHFGNRTACVCCMYRLREISRECDIKYT